MKKLNRIYLVLEILFGIAGVVQCVRWSISSGSITAGYLLNFVPAVAFGLAYIAGRSLARKITHFVAIPFFIIALAFWGFIAVGMEMFISTTSEVTDTRKYEQILDDYWSFNKTLVAHFPRPINQLFIFSITRIRRQQKPNTPVNWFANYGVLLYNM